MADHEKGGGGGGGGGCVAGRLAKEGRPKSLAWHHAMSYTFLI